MEHGKYKVLNAVQMNLEECNENLETAEATTLVRIMVFKEFPINKLSAGDAASQPYS